MFATDLQIAARNLAKHTKRNALLGAAVAAVTALLVLLGGLTAGIKASMLESATTLMTGHVNVGGFYKVTSGTSAPLVSDADRVLAEARKHVPELDYVTVRGRGWAKAVSETASMDLVLAGMDIATEPGFRRVVQPVQGKLDDLAQPGTILLFEDQAKRLGVRVGDALTLSAPTARGMNNTADVRVAVVARSIGLLSAFSAFLPADTLRELYQLKPTTTGAIHLYLKDPRASSAVAARLRGELAAAGWRVMDADPQAYWEKLMNKVNTEDWTGQKLDVTTWEDEIELPVLDPHGGAGAHRAPDHHPPGHRDRRDHEHAGHRHPRADPRDRDAARHRDAAHARCSGSSCSRRRSSAWRGRRRARSPGWPSPRGSTPRASPSRRRCRCSSCSSGSGSR